MENLVCVQIFKTRIDAEVAKGFLETNGIKAIVTADDEGGMMAPFQYGLGAQLLIEKQNEQKAKKLLENKK